MLLPTQAKLVDIRAGHHAQAQRDVVSCAELVVDPPHAVRIVSFVAGQGAQRSTRHRQSTGLSDGARETLVLGLAVAIGNVMRIHINTPRALRTGPCA